MSESMMAEYWSLGRRSELVKALHGSNKQVLAPDTVDRSFTSAMEPASRIPSDSKIVQLCPTVSS